jgi:hypothetical protein
MKKLINMKFTMRSLGLALLISLAFIGCKNKEEEAANRELGSYLPAETFLIYTMSPGQLSTKMEHDNLSKLNGYKMLLKFANESEKGSGDYIDEVIKDPSTLGIDPAEKVIIFVAESFEDDGYGGALMKIKDMEKFQAMLDMFDVPALKEDEESGLSYVQIEKDLMLFTNNYTALFLAGPKVKDNGKELGMGIFEQSPEESAYAKQEFKDAIAREDDMVFMMYMPEDLQEELKDMTDDEFDEIDDGTGALRCLIDWDNMDFNNFMYYYTLNFNKGEIVLDMIYDWDELSGSTKMGKMLTPIQSSTLSNINTDDALFTYAMALDPDYIMSVLNECGVTEMVDEELSQAMLSAEEISGWFGGTIYAQISDIREMPYRDVDYWAWEDQDEPPIMETEMEMPVFMAVMDVRDRKGIEEFMELIALGSKEDEDFSLVNMEEYWVVMPSKGLDVYIGLTDDKMYVGNDMDEIIGYVNGTYDRGEQSILARMDQQFAYMRINTNVDGNIRSMLEEMAGPNDVFGIAGMLINFVTTFDHIESQTNKDGGKVVLKMQDDSHYALYMLMEMADDASPI